MFTHAIRKFHDNYYNDLIANYLGSFIENNRYRNWYYGLSKIDITYYTSNALREFMYYNVDTYATFCFFKTKDFAKNNTHSKKIYSNISSYNIRVHIPYKIAFDHQI